ncbi:uncharacterized protein H6S33_008703 [Morchella sextelata]|uniref:uncharacterized protein n=1 Tax=Morchella sextelata TaxID=1174677 RepID=UPI001D03A888|nr:uncharacterized protein H6S33_008703 [Morchella sextelata]KAH0602364.1 hypothetical protein H6S33_008703 [Morchella sextelata]
MESPILIIATENAYFNTTPFEQEGYTTTHIPRATQRDLEDATDNIEPHLNIHSPRLCNRLLSTYSPSLLQSTPPTIQALIHLPVDTPFSPASKPPHVLIKSYQSPSGFAEPSSPTYDAIASSIAYTRTLELLRRTIGPIVSIMTTFGSVI